MKCSELVELFMYPLYFNTSYCFICWSWSFFHMCTDSRADVISEDKSLRQAWSSFITYSLCHQSKHPPVIILLNASDWWVMEGNTINSCFFGGKTFRLLQNFKFSVIIRHCTNSELLKKSFWCNFSVCVYVRACACVYVCVWSRVGVHSVA